MVPTELETEDSEEEAEVRRERKGVAPAKIETPLPVFTGRNIVFWAKDFARFLRLTGQTKASDMIKADLVVTGCKADWLRQLLEDLLSESNTFVEFLSKIEETFPVFETDMHIRQQLLDLSKFKEFPKLDEINQMEARIRKLVARLTCGYFEYDKLILLRSKIPAKTWSECKDTPARKALTHSYSDLLRLLKALSMERESDQAADRHAHLNYAQYNAEAELFTGEGKGEGKGGGKGKGKGQGEAAAKAKVEEAGNGRKNILHLLSRLPSTANTVEKGTTQRRIVGRSKRMTRNNKKTGMHNTKHHRKVNLLTTSRPRSRFRSLRRSVHLHRSQHRIPLLWQHLKRKEATKRRGSCCPWRSPFSSNARSTEFHSRPFRPHRSRVVGPRERGSTRAWSQWGSKSIMGYSTRAPVTA